MALTLSSRCASVTPSATLAIDAKAKALKSQGKHIVGFGAGEPNFPTPSYICDAAHRAIDLGITRYTPSSGTPELKRAICQSLEATCGLSYTPEEIIVSNGAKHSLYNAFFAILNPGDEVLLPSPFWVSYPEIIRMAGGVPVLIETTEEDGFLPHIESFVSALTSRTKAIVINSPCNPTGCVYPRSLLAKIADFAVQNELFIISDEIYERLIYSDQPHVSIASLGKAVKAQTLVINGLSKTYAMTGWRIGYTAGPAPIISAMTAYQSHATSNPNSIAQYAAAEALQGGWDYIRQMRETFDRRRRKMVRLIEEIPSLSCREPMGAFYVMLNCKNLLGLRYEDQAIGDMFDFSRLLLEYAHVAVVPGDPFGAPGYCRLSYAVSDEDIETGIRAIADFVSKLV